MGGWPPGHGWIGIAASSSAGELHRPHRRARRGRPDTANTSGALVDAAATVHFLAAAKVGGIANSTAPAEFLYDNLAIAGT
jgi:hypothetical protein